MALTAKQRRFVDEYLIDLNATQAAIRAGYAAKTAQEQGSRLLSNVMVAKAIAAAMKARSKATGIDAERVLKEIACMAFYDVADIASAKINGPADIVKLPESVRRAIIGWGWDKAGNFTLKLSPKTPSLDQLGRHLKLFTDKVEHAGTNGGPIQTASMSPDEFRAIAKEISNEI